jgi:hypothetical protein
MSRKYFRERLEILFEIQTMPNSIEQAIQEIERRESNNSQLTHTFLNKRSSPYIYCIRFLIPYSENHMCKLF